MKKNLSKLTLALLLLTACETESITPVDTCIDVPDVNTTFKMYEQVGDSLIETNKVIKRNQVVFKAPPGKFDSVIWRVGNDPRRFTGNTIYLRFPDPISDITVTMSGYGKANTGCGFTGQITKTQNLSVFNRDNTPAICGRFKGYLLDAPADTFTVLIHYVDSINCQSGFYISNFPKGCTTYAPVNIFSFYCHNTGLPFESPVGYSAATMENIGALYAACGSNVTGFAKITNGNTLNISFSKNEIPKIPQTFIGIRQ
jgi:hypothetical protein